MDRLAEPDHRREPVAQPVRIVVEFVVVDCDRLSRGERRERGRQVLCCRHPGTLHENRHDRDGAAKRRFHFETNEIGRQVEPSDAVGATDRCPSRPDDDEHGGGLFERGVKGPDEVGARVDGVDVEEDAVLAEASAQMIGQPARIGGSVFSPVADEDSRWHGGAVSRDLLYRRRA